MLLEQAKNKITASELQTYINSLEKEQEREKAKRVHQYKQECNISETKVKKREIAKIEKTVDKEFINILKAGDEILDVLEEAKNLPRNIEKLQIAEYMIYRVDIRKAEKIINKTAKKLENRYNDLKQDIDRKIGNFPAFQEVEEVDFSEYETQGEDLAKSKELYKLEYTEEERRELIEKDLKVIEQVKQFNSVPIPHEILRNSDRDIQSKMQKFNSIRQKRIKILDTMGVDYEKLLDPREELSMIEQAVEFIKTCEEILTKTEYSSIKNVLNRRKRKIYRSTNDIRSIIATKEKKTGIANFNIQQARYVRMENLRNTISKATALIRENPIEEVEEQLEKLKISYEREKQFASVIQNLNNGRDGNNNAELKAYEQQINSLGYKLINSRRIVEEEQDKIKNAKKELLVLWKMEINAAVDKKKENLGLLVARRKKSK